MISRTGGGSGSEPHYFRDAHRAALVRLLPAFQPHYLPTQRARSLHVTPFKEDAPRQPAPQTKRDEAR